MADSSRGFFSPPKFAALLALLIATLGLSARLPAQDEAAQSADAPQCPAPASVVRHTQPGQTSADAESTADTSRAVTNKPGGAAPPSASAGAPASQPDAQADADATQPGCTSSPRAPRFSRYLSASNLFSSSSASSSSSSQSQIDQARSPNDTRAANLYAIAHPTNGKYPVTLRTGKWDGEEWEPAFLQTLGFTLVQNGYRLATEQKTRHALTLETWHSYWLSISGLHTWSDGGKTWTVYIAHPAQGAVFNDIFLEHDPHAALVPFGFNKVYWGERIKSFWWDSLWELQWKFGPFSEASIGNVGLIPGKLGANTIVSSALIGTGLSAGEDMLDRYGIAKWETHTNNRVAVGFLRTGLNPDRSFANLFRKKWPWYRDRRPTLRDREPPLP